jgi:hypothetical protein
MRFSVLDAGEPRELAAWLELWLAWPEREIMAHPEYARLFARPCDRVVCVAAEVDGGGGVLLPLLLRPLGAEPWARPGERRWDAVTPYGYGGPFAWGSAARDDEAFWRAHATWCRDQGLVTTFFRLSLFPEQMLRLPWPVETRSTNIVLPVAAGPEAIWRGYQSKVRRWVHTAERAGIEVHVDRDASRLDAFRTVYGHTMCRRGASPWYFFPRSFFESIRDRFPGQYAFFHAALDGEVVSSDLALCSERRIYYFLGGTLQSAFAHGANYLVKHRMALWAAAAGKQACVLGGGYEPEDGIYRYKHGFARHGTVPFQVVSAVHDERSCRELTEDRAAFAAREGDAWQPRPAFFPPYRS